jgi:uracil phosphoribosyltransferase
MRIVMEDALAEFPSHIQIIDTPCAMNVPATASSILPSQICIIAMIPNGDCFIDVGRQIEPHVSVGKLLIQPDHQVPSEPLVLQYCKLPPKLSTDNVSYVLLTDSVVSTAALIVKALTTITGPPYHIPANNIVFASIFAGPNAMQQITSAYPATRCVTAAIIERLNDMDTIVPGITNFNDRYYNQQ